MERTGSTTLLKTTSIYMIGSMLSKLLNLVMLPYISIQLNATQYGIFDLIQTISSIALPIFTLQAIEAAFRFVYLAKNQEKEQILSNVWAIIIAGTITFSVLLYIVNHTIFEIAYARYLLYYFIFNVLINMYQRIARCYNNNKVYAISGVIQTIVMLILQYVFLRFFNMKEDGLIYAYAVSAIIASVYIELSVRSLKSCNFKFINAITLKKIIKFSAPLIPNSISWWTVSSVNRIIIVSFIGYSANGIFSMSNKFASIVTMIASTFQMAWQEYGLTEKDNPNRTKLFSNVFFHFMIILFCITAGGILIQQLFFNVLISPEYTESYFYIPIVMIGVAISSINSFYGAGYFIYEKTSEAFKTTVVGATINLTLCFLLVKPFGLYGISFSGIVAYLFMWINRAITMRKYFRIIIDPLSLVVGVTVVSLSVIVFYMNNNYASIAMIILICLVFMIKYRKMIQNIIKRK